jgi:putative protein-disulfide isomerase
MKPLLIYCYDAYCGWCYGFAPIIRQVATDYKRVLDIEVISGGLILPDQPKPLKVLSRFLEASSKEIETKTGARFGDDYLWHIEHPDETDWFPNSEKPAIALCIFKEYYPQLQVEFATDVEFALFFEGRDLTDDEAYRHLLEKYHLPVEEFYEKLASPAYRDAAREEFKLAERLNISSFPVIMIQSAASKFYLVSQGYMDHSSVKRNIDEVLHSITSFSSS